MKLKSLVERSLKGVRLGLAGIALFQFSVGGPVANAQEQDASSHTRTPIKHVIVIIGENRSFDHVFATYVPKNGQLSITFFQKASSSLTQINMQFPGPIGRKLISCRRPIPTPSF